MNIRGTSLEKKVKNLIIPNTVGFKQFSATKTPAIMQKDAAA